jgi:hypothetical protein
MLLASLLGVAFGGAVFWLGWAIDAVVFMVLGALLGLGMVALLTSHLAFGFAFLVGKPEGLQLIYPLGLHRWSKSSRLLGQLDHAQMLVETSVLPIGRRGPEMIHLTVFAPEGTLVTQFRTRMANRDFQKRFEYWVVSRQADPATGRRSASRLARPARIASFPRRRGLPRRRPRGRES